jgi:pilus biogenesis lipoprotein CpaD
MRVAVVLLATASLAACNGLDPVAQQAAIDTRYEPVRADTMLAINIAPGEGGPDSAQVGALKSMAASGRRAQRDEYVVVSDGSGGAAQRHRAHQVGRALSEAGARWVSTSIEPALATGPNTVVVVRSEYLIGSTLCPDYNPATLANTNEGVMPGFGCGDAYNMGQMLARPRDAAIGRAAGPADGTVNAAAIARYHEGKVPALNSPSKNTLDVNITGGGNSAGGGTSN